MDRPVAPTQQAVESGSRDARADVSIADRVHDRFGREPVRLDDGVRPSHLERVVRVAAADQRKIPLGRQLFDERSRTRVFAVDLDRVEGDVLEFPHRTVSKGVGDDRGAVALVGQLDRLARRERPRFGLRRRIRTDDENVAAVGRDLDPRQRFGARRRIERRVVIVIGRRDTLEAAAVGRPHEQPSAERVESVAEAPAAVKESRVSVEIDGVHESAYAGQTLLRWAGVFRGMHSDGADDRVLVLNPVSGSQDHVDDVVELAGDHGFAVRKTEEGGDAERFAREAVPDADLVAAVGGDGTVNEVINGIVAADALESTTVGVIPAGTGNNFAANIGIEGVEHGFEVIEHGRRQQIDLGAANDRAFVNSCIGGITAEASSETTTESKKELGVLAYVKNTFDTVDGFDSLPLRVETAAGPNGETARNWEGEALFVLIGNCRRFTGARTAQANVEDGLLEVTIVEDAATTDLIGSAALEGLFGRESEHIVRRRAPSLAIESRRSSVEYSLDGEMLETESLSLETTASALEVTVGERYRSNPDEAGETWPFNA